MQQDSTTGKKPIESKYQQQNLFFPGFAEPATAPVAEAGMMIMGQKSPRFPKYNIT
jgi:hypothetical protein